MLKYLVKGQNIELLEHEIIAADQISFVKVHFAFDNNWKPLHKVVQFCQDEDTFYRVLGIDGTSCLLPAELHPGTARMSLFGYDTAASDTVRATTVVKTLNIRPSGFESGVSVPPSPDLYQQLIAQIEDMLKNHNCGGSGANGLSAYELAVQNGFRGTLAQWLESLKGKDGADGRDGKDGRDGLDGKDGADGKDGRDGRDGVDGKDGKDGASCTAIPLLDNTGYKIVCGGDSVGVLLHGLNGRDGVDGKDGIDGKDGRDGVDGKDGKDCDCCDSSKITKKTWENLNPNVDYCQFQDARDGQWYRCVVIGNQTWMAENLNFANTVSESWCYGNKEENCDIYGRLYTWAAAANLPENYNNTTAGISSKHQGACPAGWHLPTNAEWNTLASYISQRNSLTGKALLSKTYGGTDEFGFSAMLAGNWKTDLIERSDYFDNMNWVADFWSATESSYTAIRRNIGYYDSVSLNEEYEEKYEWGYSVRCVKN